MVATQFPKIAGNYPTVALAPMAGITDRVFRDLCRQQGADYAVSEMVASKPELWHSLKSSTRHADASETSPRIVQLLGTDPKLLSEAAKWQADQGAEVIDLNLGCPAKKVCDLAAGSALMAYPDKVAQIFEALTQATNLPVSAKIRTGTDQNNKNALQIGLLAQEHGLCALTVHGRTRQDKFNGQAEYDTIKSVKAALNIPVIANGDISTPDQALFVLKYTACDGIMIGRAAQGNPWLFRAIQNKLHQRPEAQPPSRDAFTQVLTQHIAGLHVLYGEAQGVKIARKHFAWYLQAHQDTLTLSPLQVSELRKNFSQLNSAREQLNLIEAFYE